MLTKPYVIRGARGVGNEIEDVIKGIRGGLSESIQLLGSVRMDPDSTQNFPDDSGPKNEIGRKGNIRSMLHFLRLKPFR